VLVRSHYPVKPSIAMGVSMTAYIIRRLILAVIVLIIVSIIVFLAMRLLPGDPILLVLSQQEMATYTPEQVAYIKHEMGLDRPLVVQYFDWIGGVLRGDFGISILYRYDVLDEVARALPKTLYLGILALIIGFVIGIPAGVICAVRRGTWWDTVVSILANIGITVPIFWLGIILMFFLTLKLGLLPSGGYTSPFTDFWKSTRQIIMPVICLAIIPISQTTRQTRSSMLEVLQQDYIRTAWSKGLRERLIISRHALKNALIPVVTLTGLGVGMIVGGQVLIETVFNIPGMGRLLVQAILALDYPVTQGISLIIATAIVLVNLFIDLSYGWLDPRIRYR
jgi:peptide/nickel transport system permease protein